MGAGVAGLEVVRVVGAGDGRADGPGDRQRLAGDLDLLGQTVGLDLHEVVVLAEDFLVPPGGLPRPRGVARAERARDLGVETAREHEQAGRVLGEQLLVHARLVVETLQVGLGDELDQVPVASEIAHQHGQVVGALVATVLGAALGPPAGGDVELAAHDGLDPGLLGGQVEIDGAEEVAVVGERDRRELQALGLGHELLELGGAVEEAVLRVDVEVDEVGVLHGGRATRARWWPEACW